MRYHVTMSCTGSAIPAGDPKVGLAIVEQTVLPTLDALTKWEREKRVYGGCVAGAREISFFIEANSNEEASELVHGLPLWAFVKTEIKPVEGFETRLNFDRKFLTEAKKRY